MLSISLRSGDATQLATTYSGRYVEDMRETINQKETNMTSNYPGDEADRFDCQGFDDGEPIIAAESGPIPMPHDLRSAPLGEMWSVGYSICYGTLNGDVWYAWISGGDVLASATGPNAQAEIICLVANTCIVECNDETGERCALLDLVTS